MSHLPVAGMSANVFDGPHTPVPGPVFESIEMQLPKPVSASSPKYVSTVIPNTTRDMYMNRKLSDRLTLSSETIIPFIFSPSTARGWSWRINSLRTLLAQMSSLMTFIPPPVLPAQAPMAMMTSVGIQKQSPHAT